MKIITRVYMLLCLLIGIIGVISTNAYVYANESYLLGDVNNDGKVSIRDATYIQAYIAKVKDFDLDEKGILKADVNEDGNVNVLDATIIQKFRIGMDTNTRINQYIELTEPTTEETTDNQWLPGFFD